MAATMAQLVGQLAGMFIVGECVFFVVCCVFGGVAFGQCQDEANVSEILARESGRISRVPIVGNAMHALRNRKGGISTVLIGQ